ncbi:hypothetical protein [Arhodomonas sp. AD133]|uniref:hypothetical protein n=1 Tax=Arhodomonas sp. AD133 TaxID=3415009 RepID=UPI003EBF814A
MAEQQASTETQTESNKGRGRGKAAKVAVLRVSAKRARFRRGGLEFNRSETVVRLADLSDEQAEVIRAEPMLMVREDEIEAD